MRTVRFTVSSDGEYKLIRQYLEMVKPIHGMTKAEMDVVATIIQRTREENGELSRVLGFDGRQKLRDELDLSENALNIILFRLRKKGVLTESGFSDFLRKFDFDQEGVAIQFILRLHA